MLLASSRNRVFLVSGILMIAALIVIAWATLGAAQGHHASDRAASIVAAQTGVESGGGATIPYDGPSGIWVSGSGKASGAPDIAMISLGVESLEDTAAEARANAAKAMNGVMTVLEDAGVESEDIQTSYFNISPRHQGVEVERCEEDDDGVSRSQEKESSESCYRVWESRLVGYVVSNTLSVKIRDLDDAGTIIDEVSEAAGDLVRINGINFAIDDPQSLQDEARTAAVADMQRKAGLLAELSGITLGRLVYINEGSSYVQPPQPAMARAESLAFTVEDSTSISAGQLEFTMRVQGVFLIEDAD